MVHVGRFMVFDIGCIECGESSAIVGFFDDESAAKNACTEAAEAQRKNWTGQHQFEIYDLINAKMQGGAS